MIFKDIKEIQNDSRLFKVRQDSLWSLKTVFYQLIQ